MKKSFTLLLAMLLLVSGCTNQLKDYSIKQVNVDIKSTPPVDFIPKKISIVSAGDSLTEGVGDSTNKGGYIPYLRKDLQTLKSVRSVSFSNYGVKGNRTDQLLERLKKPELRQAISNSDLVIITIGGNDIMKVFRENFGNLEIENFETALIGYKQRLNNIFQTIRKYNPNTGIVLVGIYNPFMKWFSDIKEVDEIITDWNNTSKQVVDQYYKAKFIPVFDIFENQEENLLYTDYFHPNDLGYKLMAERIFSYLNKKQLSQLIE